MLHFVRTCCAFAMLCVVATGLPARAQSTGAIDGTVADARSGLSLPNATVGVIGQGRSAQSDAHGAFRIDGVPPGIYHLRIARGGYAAAESDDVIVVEGGVAHVTLSLEPSLDARDTEVIGRTATRAANSLQQATTISRTLSTETLQESGYYRAGDALKQLPSVTNSITGDTGALGDDLPLQIRGLGAAETVTTLDGHPLASGASGGFNFQVSPLVGIRSYSVIYGTGGADTLGVNAVGGVIDARTIDPSRAFAADLTQGYGTYNRLSSIAQATGTAGQLGYAAAVGVYGLDGPLRNVATYDPAVSWDPSSASPAILANATYPIDSSAVSRTAMYKLSYALAPSTALTFTSYASSYWEDKSGNGDQDYQTYAYSIAKGNSLLAGKAKTDPCPAGQFQAKNSYGVPWGTGPNGLPDGGAAGGCVTPALYAADTTGPAGAGPAYQTINLNDEHLNLLSSTPHFVTDVDLYTNRYLVSSTRANGLPDYVAATGSTTGFPYSIVPGTGGSAKSSLYLTSGGHVAGTFLWANNDLTVGYLYNNASDSLATNNVGAITIGNSNAAYYGPYLREVYRVPSAPVTLSANAYFLTASATNTSYVNPRFSIVYTPAGNTVVRGSVGASTTQPTANYLNQPFVPSNAVQSIIGAGGGGKPTCSSFSIGSAPSSILQPERGVDEEGSIGHRFWSDTNVQATFFNENIYNKIYSGITVPISLTAPPFPIAPSVVTALQTALNGFCGVGGYTTVLSETANLGQLRTQGIVLDGRIRATPRVFADYDYAVTSTVLVNGVPQLLQKNLTYVPGSQFPHVPLQTFTVALDALVTPAVEFRYDFNTVSADNTKALPAYDYSDVVVTAPVGPGKLSFAVTNLFNEWSNNFSLENTGVPLALNSYATASSYAPQLGKSATEQLALQPRMLFVNYAIRIR